MKTTIAVLICILLPLLPQAVIMLFETKKPQEEEFEFDYR